MEVLTVEIEAANIADAAAIQALVNDAYSSPDAGRSWTNESKVVVGERITLEQTQALWSAPNTTVFTVKHNHIIVGTVTLIHENKVAKLNMLAVNPTHQQYGIGKQLMAFSEKYLRDNYQSRAIRIDVVSSRVELIRFYERWGFVNCHTPYPYPTHLVVAKPIDDQLMVHVFEKEI